MGAGMTATIFGFLGAGLARLHFAARIGWEIECHAGKLSA